MAIKLTKTQLKEYIQKEAIKLMKELDNTTYANLSKMSPQKGDGDKAIDQVKNIKKLSKDLLDRQFVGKALFGSNIKQIDVLNDYVELTLSEQGHAFLVNNGTYKIINKAKYEKVQEMSDAVLMSKIAKAYLNVDISPKSWKSSEH